METITLTDGTVLNGHCIQSDDDLFVYLDGMTITEGFMIFSDAERIRTLEVYSHGNTHVYEGYVRLAAINGEYGNCNIRMRKE